MLLRTYNPPMPLSLFVDYFWYMEDYSPSHSKELALPDGSVDVIIDLREDKIRLFDGHQHELVFGHSILCGPHSEYFVIDTACESRVIGIHFKPGGIPPFLKEPIEELHNKHFPLDILWGSKVGEIRDELLASSAPEEMFHVLERRLLSLVVRDLEWHPAVQFVLSHLHGYRIAELIDQIGISHRRFNQLFKAEVGMTPKRLNRLYRFQEVLRFVHSEENISWIDIAQACGYYDQAHFIKDFKSFSGINPSEYRPISGRHHNHAKHIT
ncbi:helix-turn-helix domain-containing protein [Paenibacillus sp. J5C_2022]|uniref:helix-turn-helix transcriptional regulator n=1 Tax=Paenibacillus sp. J5C2022 TaxID=2977129 RepID=UPI0021D319F7|nr:helix-turn-helix transcriptional regulator [Paenibacillus sp. J5C2022]MCU6711542.1 helix-turn-helix domain-containing protein [Paenibacillus sp. J5C2022]